MALMNLPARCNRTEALPWVAEPSKMEVKDARELTRLFLDRLAILEEETPEHAYARNTLIEMNMSLVHYAAGRFRTSRGDQMDDVVQVGMIGLIKAIDRFDLSREVGFTSFAIPYILGEMMRFFRDATWAVHVPRRLQEARVELAKATEELSTRLESAPTVAKLAALMDVSEDEVREAQLASNAYNTHSLDAAHNTSHQGEAALASFIGINDHNLELVEDLQTLAPLLAQLGERDRLLIHWRFADELTQAQIGQRLGITQTQVSRLLTRTIKQLRLGLLSTT
ncbi:SigB/SigF/SigG family RNA polymerase sigma factor [Streptomyces sp. NPDC001941]|uniref:SigB/SigF/SigG family RNA polymerase sigma factor n=1 Tax=Streptomyces sp. NPDC001941 TaxID=3154659 RepID=UPI0033288820